MKKIIIVIMFLIASFSFAGDFGLFKAAPTVGIIIPEANWKTGPLFGVETFVGSLSEGKIELYPSINYWSSKYTWENTFGGDIDLDLKMSNIRLGVDGHYNLSKYVAGLYAGIGLALNLLSVEHPESKIDYLTGAIKTKTSSDAETKLSLSLLTGYNYNNFFIESTLDLMDPNTFSVKGGMWFDLKK